MGYFENLEFKCPKRPLRKQEIYLLKCLLKDVKEYSLNLENQMVIEMVDDGGMGSLYFVSKYNPKERNFYERIAEKEFKDSDNIPILVGINIDQFFDLFELDIWKVDNNPVILFPTCK